MQHDPENWNSIAVPRAPALASSIHLDSGVGSESSSCPSASTALSVLSSFASTSLKALPRWLCGGQAENIPGSPSWRRQLSTHLPVTDTLSLVLPSLLLVLLPDSHRQSPEILGRNQCNHVIHSRSRPPGSKTQRNHLGPSSLTLVCATKPRIKGACYSMSLLNSMHIPIHTQTCTCYMFIPTTHKSTYAFIHIHA